MELPLEEVWGLTSTARHEESETGSGRPSYADVELEQDQEGSGGPSYADVVLEQDQEGSVRTPASRNEESEIDNDEQDKERSVPLLTSRNEGSDTDSGEQDKGRRTPTPTSLNEESDTDSGGKSSDDDVEIEQGRIVCSEDSSGDSSTEVLDDQTLAEEEEGARDGNAHMQEEQSSPKASAEEQYAPSSSVDGLVEESMEIGSEIAELNKQVLGDDVGTAFSASAGESERDKNAGLQSLNAPIDKESKPSSSQVNVARDIGPESVEFDVDDPTETEDEYVKKGFTCDGNVEEEDEHLREYWTRALQTSTSTGQVVEEIVKVLKHHQKTHDLLCPVCGSCVTRRVILRKRKRSSLISVDRWYHDPLDEGEIQEQGSSLEVMEAGKEEDSQEYQDTKAFGCLACFSLFVEKGYLLLNQLQADIGSDTFNCLPFFFPPYPWGMTQMKPRSPGVLEEEPSLQEAEEAAVLDVQESLTTDVKSDFTCGIGSTLLPDYPWGTMPCLSKGDVIDPSNQSDTAVVVTGSGQDVEQACDVSQIEDIEESSQPLIKERTCTCGLAPTLLPAYPWGYCAKLEGEQIQGSEVEGPQPSTKESTCTCGLAPALIPYYPWGYLSKVQEVALQSPSDLEAGLEDSSSTLVEDTNVQSVSQPEISEEPPQLCREGKNCSCGLVPALLPDYPWGFFVKDEGSCNLETRIEPQAKAVEETKGKMAEDIGPSCDLISTVLPDYPWGITTESEEVHEEVPILREERKSRRERINFLQNGTVGSAVLPSYPWGICSVNQSVHEQNGSAQMHQDSADRDCTCGLGLTMLPTFPWGQTLAVDKQEQPQRQQVKYYIEQETKQETRITSTTDLYIVTTSESKKPPQNTKTMIPQQISQTVQHVKLDQTVTFQNAPVNVDEVSEIKGSPLVSHLSTGYARLEEGLAEKGRLETGPSTGYAYLEELSKEAESTGKDTGNTQEHPSKHQPTKSKVSFLPTKPTPTYEQELPESEIEEDPVSLKYPQPEAKPEKTLQSIPAEAYYKHGKTRPQFQPSGTQFPSFQWSVGKLDAGDLTTPLLKASLESEGETFVSVLKPSPGGVDEPKSENWLSVFKVSKPSEGGTAPLLSASGYIEEIEEVKRPVVRPQIQSVTEAVLDVEPGDLGGTSVGTTAPIAVAVPSEMKKEAYEWDILKSIVYGGLDISIASLGVTSSAAGGNAITRTVVYMGISTLLSGLIGFYHNVLNLYHYHRDHYTEIVGLTLMLHGTVALISYVVFGLLSPLFYAFSYRKTDNRDDKFILCCGVTIVAVMALALGKARVTNKRYLRTLFVYLSGGVLAAIVGYLTGEHVAELLEEWGI